mmetsp:Transcript_1953/g.2191  ORF Transcript_1953/g.2191 Transcript_1953/m.2191 type:complete len:261 (-) Transcript_1953:185-967(-)|eukprot:CAMPEP_0197847676 /NCGR_PEP_ID=MMETSP1438-20131217/6759_1 /TAXON_ID=1461541 /ORGANISM="Pterosperma sp., Strain CCMP1384" /LENGTH=260 /DNA_ID=CAMNT_0043459667 /DNA_START=112 /DNA_END=894 /DNA_ORIENTATION=-
MAASFGVLRVAQPVISVSAGKSLQNGDSTSANGIRGFKTPTTVQFHKSAMPHLPPRQRLIARASETQSEQSFEDKIANLKNKSDKRKAKKEQRLKVMTGEIEAPPKAKKGAGALKPSATPSKPQQLSYADMDFSDETVFYEGKPAVGDLAVNIGLGFTLLWLPLTMASIGRYMWINYKFTDKRFMTESSSPLINETAAASYDQVVKVQTIGRGVGLWGDMVITLKDGSKVEFRALDKYKEIEAYVQERIPASEDADPSTF